METCSTIRLTRREAIRNMVLGRHPVFSPTPASDSKIPISILPETLPHNST